MTVGVTDNRERQRYEATVDGRLAGIAQYRRRGGRVVFVHTEVRDGFEGQGVGTALAKGALDDVRDRHLSIVPLCPFIAEYIARHPEFDELVDREMLEALGPAD
jgi:predicted GNAT family acetyltransferase